MILKYVINVGSFKTMILADHDIFGYYAVVTGEGYDDEIGINYFEKCDKCWVIQDHDLDCQEKGDFKNIEKKKKNGMDQRS